MQTDLVFVKVTVDAVFFGYENYIVLLISAKRVKL